MEAVFKTNNTLLIVLITSQLFTLFDPLFTYKTEKGSFDKGLAIYQSSELLLITFQWTSQNITFRNERIHTLERDILFSL